MLFSSSKIQSHQLSVVVIPFSFSLSTRSIVGAMFIYSVRRTHAHMYIYIYYTRGCAVSLFLHRRASVVAVVVVSQRSSPFYYYYSGNWNLAWKKIRICCVLYTRVRRVHLQMVLLCLLGLSVDVVSRRLAWDDNRSVSVCRYINVYL